MGGKGSGGNHKGSRELSEYEQQRNALIPEAIRLANVDIGERKGKIKKKDDRDHVWNSLYFWNLDHLWWMHEHPKP